MLEQIKALITTTPYPLADYQIEAAISLASQHYLRLLPDADTDWGNDPNAYSWVFEYALSYCKMLIGERNLMVDGNAQHMIHVASGFLFRLEDELRDV
jgi:hypothetical protein